MWCLVSQPNAVVIEVRLDHKAKGLECLEKVSSKICSHDLGTSLIRFFGILDTGHFENKIFFKELSVNWRMETPEPSMMVRFTGALRLLFLRFSQLRQLLIIYRR